MVIRGYSHPCGTYVAIIATRATALALIVSVDLGELADTTVLLLLVVLTAVNIAVLVLRRDRVPHSHFHTPSFLPVLGAGVCIALMTTKQPETFARAGALMIVGVILWAINRWLHGRHVDPYATAQLEAVERPDLS